MAAMLSDQWLPTVGCARRFGGGARDRSADEIGGARAGQELAGIFKIVGYNSVGKDSNGRNRVEFDLVASDAKLPPGPEGVRAGGYTAQRALEAGMLDELQIDQSRCCSVVAVGCSTSCRRTWSWTSSG